MHRLRMASPIRFRAAALIVRVFRRSHRRRRHTPSQLAEFELNAAAEAAMSRMSFFNVI
jgi:hypothetical protein